MIVGVAASLSMVIAAANGTAAAAQAGADAETSRPAIRSVLAHQRMPARERPTSDVSPVRVPEKRDGDGNGAMLVAASDAVGATGPSGAELWDRTIAYHDPSGRWATFEGKVRIINAQSTGSFSHEELELRNTDDFYQVTRLLGEGRTTMGVHGGTCIQSVNGDSTPGEAEIERLGIGCERARLMREHHAQHFGFPMELKRSGIVVEEQVTLTDLRGRPVLALRFTGRPEAVKHAYYAGTWTLFIDPESSAMRGFRVQNELFPDISCTYEGELEVGGVRMAQAKTCYREGTYFATDTFAYIADQ